MDFELQQRVHELERIVGRLLRYGTVSDADHPAGRVRVCYDHDEAGNPIRTGWLPWFTHRAGADRTWWPPTVGEQVMVLSPFGAMECGMVLPAGYSDAAPAPSTDPDTHTTVYQDGTKIEYNRVIHRLTLNVMGDVVANVQGNVDAVVGGTVDVVAGGAVSVDAPAIHHNGGVGVVTGECVCHFTGKPHGDKSSTVTAGK
jgi:phage baseplate assembly protein V